MTLLEAVHENNLAIARLWLEQAERLLHHFVQIERVYWPLLALQRQQNALNISHELYHRLLALVYALAKSVNAALPHLVLDEAIETLTCFGQRVLKFARIYDEIDVGETIEHFSLADAVGEILEVGHYMQHTVESHKSKVQHEQHLALVTALTISLVHVLLVELVARLR